MREIKFRGISREDFCKGQWIYGSLHQFKGYAIFEKDIKNWISVAKNTIGQYTGLKDKNGKEIYEGDILRLTGEDILREYDWKAIVEFGNPNYLYSWGFQLKPITEFGVKTDILLWVEMEEAGVFCEIIGNIYENPELLKEK